MRFFQSSDKDVVTAYGFSLLLYGMELLFYLSLYGDQNRVRSVYYSLVHLMTSVSHWTPRAVLDRISGCATCDQ